MKHFILLIALIYLVRAGGVKQPCHKFMKLIDPRKLPKKFDDNGFCVEFTVELEAIAIVFKRCIAFNTRFLYMIIHVFPYLIATLDECYMYRICVSTQMMRLKVMLVPVTCSNYFEIYWVNCKSTTI